MKFAVGDRVFVSSKNEINEGMILRESDKCYGDWIVMLDNKAGKDKYATVDNGDLKKIKSKKPHRECWVIYYADTHKPFLAYEKKEKVPRLKNVQYYVLKMRMVRE